MAFEMERNALVASLQDLVNRKDDGKPPTDTAFANIEAAVEWNGKKIILPADPRNMGLREAREWLARLEQSDEEAININEVIDAHPWDGCVAFLQAMKETYGWASPTPTGPWWRRHAPTMISIETGVGETATIFWGGFQLPNVDGQLVTGTEEKRGQVRFCITGQVKRKHAEMVHALAELTRRIVAERSIYRGHAIKLALDNGEINLMEPPTFMNLKRVRENELVFSEDLQVEIDTNLWTPIEHTEWWRREHEVPLQARRPARRTVRHRQDTGGHGDRQEMRAARLDLHHGRSCLGTGERTAIRSELPALRRVRRGHRPRDGG